MHGFFLSADVKDGELLASTMVRLNNHSHGKHYIFKKNWLTNLRTLEDPGLPKSDDVGV
jgi:hypothetical protein